MSSSDFSKPYDPKDVEPRWRARAEASDWYAARDVGAHEDSFCIMIPPPNVTGSLHMGHALFITLQDAMVRHARMHGKNTLWRKGAHVANVRKLERFRWINTGRIASDKALLFAKRVDNLGQGSADCDQPRGIGKSLDDLRF